MENKFEKSTAAEKVSAYIDAWRPGLIVLLVAAIVGVSAYAAGVALVTRADKNGLAAVDTISYNLTEGSASLSDAELAARRNDALVALEPYVTKRRITGVRANMLAAEIAYSQEDFSKAASYWLTAAAKGRDSYTAPLAYFNAAVCFENSGDLDNAVKNYKTAAETEDFLIFSHASFCCGRTLENQGNADEAIEVYNKLYGKTPDDSWAKLAKSRIIALEASKEIKPQ
ncbi:MAG: tetratricopeptide repeat protein [Treponema sp.]